MTTPVVEHLAALLGDDIDRSRFVHRDGVPVVRGWAHGYGYGCIVPREERANA